MQILETTADTAALIERVAQLIDAGRTAAARPLLAAARRLAPPSAHLSRLGALLALQDGTLEAARDDLDQAVTKAPCDVELRLCRAELRQRLGDVEGATRDAAEAVILDRRNPAPKALLGVMMLELGRPKDAIACLTDAVGLRPADASYREALSAALEADQDPDAALRALEEGIAAAPGATALRNAAVLLCIRRRRFTRALELAEAARRDGVADACLFGLKGHALSSLGRLDDAADAYRDALKLGPDDPYVRHLVASSGTMPGQRQAPADYLRAVFDGYADRFESHLLSLGYRTPGVFRALLADHPVLTAGQRLGPVLELGCGTGLVAVALSDLQLGPLTGVDISPRMLAQADAKQVYASLQEADIVDYMRRSGESFPLILAADVLCYSGDLQPVLDAAHASLLPHGWFVMSLEELLPDADGGLPGNGDWALLRQGRYVHSAHYLLHMAEACGFTVRQFLRHVARHEAGEPVQGMVAVLQRGGHDA